MRASPWQSRSVRGGDIGQLGTALALLDKVWPLPGSQAVPDQCMSAVSPNPCSLRSIGLFLHRREPLSRSYLAKLASERGRREVPRLCVEVLKALSASLAHHSAPFRSS